MQGHCYFCGAPEGLDHYQSCGYQGVVLFHPLDEESRKRVNEFRVENGLPPLGTKDR
jgi:hypothetical protein